MIAELVFAIALIGQSPLPAPCKPVMVMPEVCARAATPAPKVCDQADGIASFSMVATAHRTVRVYAAPPVRMYAAPSVRVYAAPPVWMFAVPQAVQGEPVVSSSRTPFGSRTTAVGPGFRQSTFIGPFGAKWQKTEAVGPPAAAMMGW